LTDLLFDSEGRGEGGCLVDCGEPSALF